MNLDAIKTKLAQSTELIQQSAVSPKLDTQIVELPEPSDGEIIEFTDSGIVFQIEKNNISMRKIAFDRFREFLLREVS